MAKWTQGELMTDNDMFFAKQAAATQSIQYMYIVIPTFFNY